MPYATLAETVNKVCSNKGCVSSSCVRLNFPKSDQRKAQIAATRQAQTTVALT